MAETIPTNTLAGSAELIKPLKLSSEGFAPGLEIANANLAKFCDALWFQDCYLRKGMEKYFTNSNRHGFTAIFEKATLTVNSLQLDFRKKPARS